jgi:uncharacterized oligopeptide transporter (OPT) family protein
MWFGLQTGWVTMASVQAALLGFGSWKVLHRVWPSSAPLTIAENVMMQAVAVAAATMPLAAGFVGIIPALRILQSKGEGVAAGATLPLQTPGAQIVWCLSVAFLGVFVAVPLRFYVTSLKFPSGTATAVAIQSLHENDRGTAMHRKLAQPSGGESASVLSGGQRRSDPSDTVALTASAVADYDSNPLVDVEGDARAGASSLIPDSPLADDTPAMDSGTLAPVDATRGTLPDSARETDVDASAAAAAADAASSASLSSTFRAAGIAFGASASLSLASFFFPVLGGVPVFSYVGLSGVSAWGWTATLSLSYAAQGMIMGMHTCVSMLAGALLGWGLIGPVMQHAGVVTKPLSSSPGGGRSFLIWISLAIMLAEAAASAAITLWHMWRGFSWAKVRAALGRRAGGVSANAPRRAVSLTDMASDVAGRSGDGAAAADASGPRPSFPSSNSSAGRISFTDSGMKQVHLLGDGPHSAAAAENPFAADGSEAAPAWTGSSGATPARSRSSRHPSSPVPRQRAGPSSASAATAPVGRGRGAVAAASEGAAGVGSPSKPRGLHGAPGGPQQVLPTWAWSSGLLVCVVVAVVALVPLANVSPGESLAAVLFSVPISVVAVRALGETDLNPVSGLGKITQVAFGAMFPHNLVGNVIAGAVAEASAQQAGDLMQDLKTGYLLGVPLPAQFVGQLIGSLVSVFASTLAFAVFDKAYGVPSPSLPAPTASIWVSMAELMGGAGSLPHAVVPFVVVAAVLSFALTIALVVAESSQNVEPEERASSGADDSAVRGGAATAVDATAIVDAESSDARGDAVDARLAVASPTAPVPRWLRWLQRAAPYVPSPTGFAIGMYISPNWTLPRFAGAVVAALLARRLGSSQQLIIMLATGFVLGEGILSLVTATLAAAGARPISCGGCDAGTCGNFCP